MKHDILFRTNLDSLLSLVTMCLYYLTAITEDNWTATKYNWTVANFNWTVAKFD